MEVNSNENSSKADITLFKEQRFHSFLTDTMRLSIINVTYILKWVRDGTYRKLSSFPIIWQWACPKKIYLIQETCYDQ